MNEEPLKWLIKGNGISKGQSTLIMKKKYGYKFTRLNAKKKCTVIPGITVQAICFN